MAGIPKNYRYAEFDKNRYYFGLYDNKGCDKTWMEILDEEKKNGAIGIINTSYFSLSTGDFQSATKIDGQWLHDPKWLIYGICINKDGYMSCGTYEDANAFSFTEGCPPQYINKAKSYNYTVYDTNGSTYIGFKEDGTICLLLCDKDNGISSKEADEVMLDAGCIHVIRMDGSWSSHGKLGYNEICSPSQYRYDRLYLIIYDKLYQAPRTNYKITLDCYGDFSPSEHPVTRKMVNKLQEIFNRQGIECMISTFEDNYNLDSNLRAKQSNTWKADISLSIDADLIDDSKARVTSSSAGANAGRNVMGACIIKALTEAGIDCKDEVTHDRQIIMLPKPNAIANFIRYNDPLMTTDNYIFEAAAEATVKGVCDYLDLEYIEPPETDKPTEDEEKTNFEMYQEAGIFSEGVQPTDAISYEEFADILAKLGLHPDSPADE